MKTSPEIDKLATDLNAFQIEMPTLPKDASGYGYRYTPLDTVMSAIRERLAQNNLSFVQMPSTPAVEYGPSVGLCTRLMHTSGQWIEDEMVMPLPVVGKANVAQQYGAALTYARRYALTSMLGIVADEDVDGATLQTNESTPVKKQHKQEGTTTAKPTVSNDSKPPTDKMRKKLWASGKSLYGDEWDDTRATIVSAVTKGRTSSSKQITWTECKTLIDGIEKKSNA